MSLIKKTVVASLVALLIGLPSLAVAWHCPFCSAINLTFTQQINKNDLVVIAKLTKIPPRSDDIDAELPKATFQISQVMKGEEFVAPGMTFKTLLVGKYDIGQEFLVMGADPPTPVWTTPMKASPRVIDYIKQLEVIPETGPDRLAFFQDYFEDKESLLAFDAYDEFAGASYEDMIALKDRMRHDQIVEWILEPEISPNRRRLYFTMLGVCGNDKDCEMLEELIKSGDRKKQAGLDALIACYLNLKKADGIDLIESQFISNPNVDYVDTLSAVSALRFHGTEVDFIPRDRIVSAVRKLLDRPKMADMIIPDLARWEDWTVMDKLVQMFKDADEETNWLRVPVISYLRACPKPEAKTHIEELRKIDPDAVRRAEFFAEYDNADDWGDEDDEEEDSSESADSAEQKEEPETKQDGPVTTTKATAAKAVTSSDVQTVTVKKPAIDSNSLAESDVTSDVESGGVSPIPGEFETPANSDQVSTVSDTMAAPSLPMETQEIAQATPDSEPVAQAATVYNSTAAIILLPMAVCAVIFVLLWSVIQGWFERLIF